MRLVLQWNTGETSFAQDMPLNVGYRIKRISWSKNKNTFSFLFLHFSLSVFDLKRIGIGSVITHLLRCTWFHHLDVFVLRYPTNCKIFCLKNNNYVWCRFIVPVFVCLVCDRLPSGVGNPRIAFARGCRHSQESVNKMKISI